VPGKPYFPNEAIAQACSVWSLEDVLDSDPLGPRIQEYELCVEREKRGHTIGRGRRVRNISSQSRRVANQPGRCIPDGLGEHSACQRFYQSLCVAQEGTPADDVRIRFLADVVDATAPNVDRHFYLSGAMDQKVAPATKVRGPRPKLPLDFYRLFRCARTIVLS
jgi:hypothetical protein